MKIGFVVDSSSGLNEQEAHKRGWFYLPLGIQVNNQKWNDGTTLLAKDFYNQIDKKDIVKTSATAPGKIMDVLTKASKSYDHVIVYPLSSKLSSQYNNLQVFSRSFPNVTIINSTGLGYAIVKDIEEASQATTLQETITQLNLLTKNQFGLAFPKRLDWLVRGGRVSPSIAKMANLLKIVPILKFKEGTLQKYGKGRIFHKAIIKTAKSFRNKNFKEWIIYCGQFEGQQEIIDELKVILKITIVKFLPPVIASHTGIEVISFMGRQNH